MDKKMMNAWLAEQAKKAELTTTKMQQKRLGIAESAIDAAGKAAGNAIGVIRKKQPWENNRLVTFDKYHKDEQQKEKLKNRLKRPRRLEISSDPRDLHPNDIPDVYAEEGNGLGLDSSGNYRYPAPKIIPTPSTKHQLANPDSYPDLYKERYFKR